MKAVVLQSNSDSAPARKQQKAGNHSVPVPPRVFQTASVNEVSIQPKADCACGGGCPRYQNNLPIQTTLAVNRPGDVYEQEADRVADEVMCVPAAAVQRTCASCTAGGSTCAECASAEKPLVQTKRVPASGQAAASVPDSQGLPHRRAGHELSRRHRSGSRARAPAGSSLHLPHCVRASGGPESAELANPPDRAATDPRGLRQRAGLQPPCRGVLRRA